MYSIYSSFVHNISVLFYNSFSHFTQVIYSLAFAFLYHMSQKTDKPTFTRPFNQYIMNLHIKEHCSEEIRARQDQRSRDDKIQSIHYFVTYATLQLNRKNTYLVNRMAFLSASSNSHVWPLDIVNRREQ